MTKSKNEENIVAFVLGDGEVVDIEKVIPPTGSKSKKKKDNTIDIDEDDFGEQYSSGRVYRPTFNLNNLKQFSLDNLFHLRCIEQLAKDCIRGWKIINVDSKGQEIKDNSKISWSTKDNRLFNFFTDSFGLDDFTSSCQSIINNFDTFGITFIEMTRTRNGTPAKFKLLPTETCRISRDLSNPKLGIDTDMKYVMQIVNTHERIFKLFDGTMPTVLEPTTGNKMSEILLLKNYHVSGGKYGIPSWVSSLKSMIGNDKVADYNISFFNNDAVPRFAVIIQGGKLDEETKKEIKSYFKKDLKGVQNSHKTLLLTGPKGTEIKLTPLAFEMQDGGFRFYRKDNRDEIIAGHGVPPHRIQVYDAGNGSNLSGSMIFELDKTYKYSIVEPIQKKLEHILNQIIRLSFDIKDRQIRFCELDIGEEEQRANTLKIIAAAHEKYYNIGSMTPDEIRADNKQAKFNELTGVDMDILEWAKTPKPVYLLRQANLQNMNNPNTPSSGVKGTVAGQGVNEQPNDFGDKSKEQTGNTLTDQNFKQLLMKSHVQLVDVIQKVDSAVSRLSEVEERIEELQEESHD